MSLTSRAMRSPGGQARTGAEVVDVKYTKVLYETTIPNIEKPILHNPEHDTCNLEVRLEYITCPL